MARRASVSILILIVLALLSGCTFFDPIPPHGWCYVDISGIVQDIHFSPVAGVKVYIYQDFKPVEPSIYTSIDGSYSFDSILLRKDINYEIKSEKENYHVGYRDPDHMKTISDYDTKTCNIVMSERFDVATISLYGTVTNTAGQPIDSVEVQVWFVSQAGSTAVSTFTNAIGYYEIENIQMFNFSHFSFLLKKSGFPYKEISNIYVVQDGSYQYDFVLKRNILVVSVVGRVLADNAEPINGSTVTINGRNVDPFSVSITTNENGYYEIHGLGVEQHLPINIEAHKSGYLSAGTTITPVSSITYTASDIILQPEV